MLMYLFTFLLLLCFALYDISQQGKVNYKPALILLAVWLIIHDGLRWGIGTDWFNYYEYFRVCLTHPTFIFEVGYAWLNQIVRFCTDSYSVFLVIHAIIVYALIIPSIRRHSTLPLVSLFIFYCLMLPVLGMNRQYIALAIIFFSFQYIFERKLLLFLLCVAVAFLFHQTALIFIPAYFLCKKISVKTMVLVIVAACIIAFTNAINYIPSKWFYLFGDSIGDKMNLYIENFTERNTIRNTILGIIKRGFLLAAILGFGKMMKNKNEQFPFFMNVYFIGVVMYIMFNNTAFQIIVSRGAIYFNIMEVFLVPYLLSVFKPGWSRRIALVILAMYYMLLIEKGFSYYKENLGFDIFRPYNSVLIDPYYESKDTPK